MKKLNHNAISAVELAIAGIIFGMASLMLFRALGFVNTSSTRLTDLAERSSQLSIAAAAIQRYGRLAEQCQKTQVSGKDALVCQIDFSRPLDGNTVAIRLLVKENRLEVQQDTSGVGDFSAFTLRQVIPKLGLLSICDDAGMAAGCGWQPAAMDALHTALVVGRENRFFRFRVGATIKTNSESFLQASFFVRNPPPFDGITFQ